MRKNQYGGTYDWPNEKAFRMHVNAMEADGPIIAARARRRLLAALAAGGIGYGAYKAYKHYNG